jgi:hypothetical protein
MANIFCDRQTDIRIASTKAHNNVNFSLFCAAFLYLIGRPVK